MTETAADSLQVLHDEIIACHACPRLTAWCEEVAQTKRRAYRAWDYWGKPVPGFGDLAARLVIVGLAPGAHGANRTFTGDGSGTFLYAALHRAGFANQPTSTDRDDGLRLCDCFITAVGRCAPPQNKLKAAELDNCRPFFIRELQLLSNVRVVLPLGRIAFDGYLRALREMGHDVPRLQFAHGQLFELPEGLPYLLPSYHVSLQNTNTGRLTAEMFDEVLARAKDICEPNCGNSSS